VPGLLFLPGLMVSTVSAQAGGVGPGWRCQRLGSGVAVAVCRGLQLLPGLAVSVQAGGVGAGWRLVVQAGGWWC
jgi:hypothetical protein